ncbi:MAG: hypothetical protein KC636_27795, partial [Myxococcales bacterium]|nr:hypothetical protein [Myxococcales bacterium]
MRRSVLPYALLLASSLALAACGGGVVEGNSTTAGASETGEDTGSETTGDETTAGPTAGSEGSSGSTD